MRPLARKSGFAILCLAAALQLWPSGRTNPPVTAGLHAPSEIGAILRRSCYDCHSNETRWPWYGWIAPVSWMLVRDVRAARADLNFSHWGEYSETKRRDKAETMLDQIRDGRMPPSGYARLHPGSAVEAGDLETLRRWVVASSAAMDR
jgi:hypothetical protein